MLIFQTREINKLLKTKYSDLQIASTIIDQNTFDAKLLEQREPPIQRKTCFNCGNIINTYEEKESDVRIATQIVSDAYEIVMWPSLFLPIAI